MACSGHQFSLCRWFTYRTIIPPTTVGYLGGVSIWWCRGLNIHHWCLDCHGLKDASLDLERCGAIVDFQTGGPNMSPLLLIYMYWKSNGFYRGKPFCPASSLPWVDIQSYPYDIIGSDTGLMWVCGGWWVTGVAVPCFSHGQLYVGCSRTTTRQGLKLLLPVDGQGTTNIVWPEALLHPSHRN